MKIAQIIPGSGGGFYCGNCLRDKKLYDAMKKLGNDVIVIPMYLPLFSHNLEDKKVPVFFGAISIYLKHVFPFLRKSPKFISRILNSKPMLKIAAKMANSTRATGLEEMTISMLMGEKGTQNEELEEMINWIKNNYKADVVHISNALLLGLAPKIKKELKVPVVCSLQDEDVWVDVMSKTNRNKVWNLIKEQAEYVDLFISVSKYYKKFMLDKIDINPSKIKTIYLGINPDEYRYINPGNKAKNIGFISRLCEANGPDILIDAFILLKKNNNYSGTKLLLTGGYTADDKKFIKKQKQKIEKVGLSNDIIWQEEFDEENRTHFFDNISILSVPVRNGEAFGIYLTEAMASGLAIVQPNLAAFPEIVGNTKAGIIVEENSAESLSIGLKKLLDNPELTNTLSRNGRIAVENQFNVNVQAHKIVEAYKQLTPM